MDLKFGSTMKRLLDNFREMTSGSVISSAHSMSRFLKEEGVDLNPTRKMNS